MDKQDDIRKEPAPDITPETTPTLTLPAAEACVSQAQAALQAKVDAFLKLLEDKRSLTWIQFATD
jgi:hypothetical protein